MNFIVETKNEYTIQLVNILTPLLYEGFESIYIETRKILKGTHWKVSRFCKSGPCHSDNLKRMRAEKSSRLAHQFLRSLSVESISLKR